MSPYRNPGDISTADRIPRPGASRSSLFAVSGTVDCRQHAELLPASAKLARRHGASLRSAEGLAFHRGVPPRLSRLAAAVRLHRQVILLRWRRRGLDLDRRFRNRLYNHGRVRRGKVPFPCADPALFCAMVPLSRRIVETATAPTTAKIARAAASEPHCVEDQRRRCSSIRMMFGERSGGRC